MKTQYWLSIVLAAQLVLALGLGLQSWQATSSASEAAGFMAVDTAAVDRVVISNGEQEVVLSEESGEWRLGEAGNLPAAAGRIEQVLEELASEEVRYPVATSQEAVTRFEVAESQYQRRLTLHAGDSQAGQYYFGTSPGFRQVHARRAGEGEVYALDFNIVDIPAGRDDWLDGSLLSAGSLRSLETEAYRLEAGEDENWRLVEPASLPGEPDQSAIRELVDSIRNLRVQGVNEQGWPAEASPFRVSVETADGSFEYEFLQQQENRYLVRRSDRPDSFRISENRFRQITEAGPETLAPAPDSEADPG